MPRCGGVGGGVRVGILNFLRVLALLVLLSERSAVFADWMHIKKCLFFPETAQTLKRAYQIRRRARLGLSYCLPERFLAHWTSGG